MRDFSLAETLAGLNLNRLYDEFIRCKYYKFRGQVISKWRYVT